MNHWIVTSNIVDFRQKLAEETDAKKCRVLENLLAEEQQKLGDPTAEEADERRR
jgi:hypothetical protein